MPHSTQDSTNSVDTFDLTREGGGSSGTPPSDSAMKNASRNSSSGYGVALTSIPLVDQRGSLPSQQQQQQQSSESGDLRKLRRRSTPGTAEDYAVADMLAQRSNLEELVRANDGRSYSYNDAAKRKTQYFEEQFQYKDNPSTQTRERVHRQTPVIAELKTNVIIKDEFTLVTDLSYQLAQRYTRPDSCIMIKVDHSACLAMGGTFDPCYNLTINTVSSQMGPATNKRNAGLIQAFMTDILSVPSERGIITFIPIPEENLATSGNTILGEMEKAEKQERGTVKGALNDAARKSMTFSKKSMPKMNGEVNGHANASNVVNGISYGNGNAYGDGNAVGASLEKKSSQTSSDSSQQERPKTAHGASTAVNGLRMNPISADELRSTSSGRLPNGRPKSVGAPVRGSSSIQDQIKQEPIPNVVRQTSQQQAARPQPVKTKSVPAKTQNHTPLAPRPVQVQPNAFTASSVTTPFTNPTTMTKVSAPQQHEKKEKAVYLDMVTALPVNSTKDASVSVSELVPSSKTNENTTMPAPNTAKRRSQTMTSTPKLPPHMHVPPPVPVAPGGADRFETRSVNSKLSKRKSIGLFKIFKRESKLEPWYKQ